MEFEKNILNLYAPQGQQWLDSLPSLVVQLAKKWELSDLQVLPHLSFNYVVGCMQGGQPAVLKIGFSKPELQYEIQALRLFAGDGCVKLLDADSEHGAFLLQRAIPGTSLQLLFPEQDRRVATIASEIIKRLQSIKTHKLEGLPHIKDWLTTLDKEWNVPQHHLEKAKALKNELLSTTIKNVLLHGDLHGGNILSCGNNKWVAIDPKGVIGDPIYEVGASIRNQIPEKGRPNEIKQIIQDRITVFSESLRFDRQRILNWAFVQVVLGACWSLEDRLDPSYFFEMAEILHTNIFDK